MKIVIVGQNLAKASKGKSPFEGTKYGAVLEEWLSAAGVRESTAITLVKVNAVNRKTPGNRPLKTSEIRRGLRTLARHLEGARLVITLGRQPLRAVRMCAYLVRGTMPGLVELEHPSGKNRNLNDPKVRAAQPERIRSALRFAGT